MCNCGKANKQEWEVVVTPTGGTERVVFTSVSKPTATTVSKRYAGSTVREKAKAGAIPPTPAQVAAPRPVPEK